MERQPGPSAVVAQFGRVGRLGASQSFGLRRQASWPAKKNMPAGESYDLLCIDVSNPPEHRMADRDWLDEATKTIGQFWKRKNARRNGLTTESNPYRRPARTL
jgi:hypothetical protein